MSNKHFDRKTQRILTMMIVALVGLLVYAAASDAGGESVPGLQSSLNQYSKIAY